MSDTDGITPSGHEETVAMGAEPSEPEAESPAAAERAGQFGRYALLERVGQGGMGAVYRAYDPQLRREVALKVVRDRAGALAERQRLLREARAMAKLQHPNVAAVYDAGEVDGEVYLAIEYIEGRTLDAWLSAESRTWQDIVRVFVETGRGLAAAHAEKLIHRDFKPPNVMVGTDDRPRVLDFGLARLVSDVTLSGQDPRKAARTNTLARPLTQVGYVMGTPAYMAPEQHAGLAPTPAWDIYAFSLALYEALYGERPFTANTVKELLVEKRGWIPESAPTQSAVPEWIYAAVRAGLDPVPERRTESMDALLDALSRDPTRVARRWKARIATAALGAIVTGTAATAYLASSDPCADAARGLDEVWNEERASGLRDAFEGTGLPYAVDAWQRVRQRVDDYAARWSAGRVDACAATHVRREQSEALLDLRVACLDTRKAALAATLTVLETPDEDAVARAFGTVSALRPVAQCSSAKLLQVSFDPPPPQLAAEVDRIRVELSRVAALLSAGRYEEALDLADRTAVEAKAIEYDPAHAEALLQHGAAARQAGRLEQAEATLSDAYFLARELRHTEVSVDAARRLVALVGTDLGRLEDGALWARHAMAELGRDREDSLVHGELENTLAGLELARGRYAEAEKHQSRALAIFESHLDPKAPRIAGAIDRAGIIASAMGRFDDAKLLHTRAIDIRGQALGTDHPAYATSLNNLAAEQIERNEIAGSVEMLERVLEIQKTALPEGHPDFAATLGNLGLAALRSKEPEKALELYQQALEISEKALGGDHPEVGHLLNSLAGTYQHLGRHEETLETLQRALTIRRKGLGERHPAVARALRNVAAALTSLKRDEESLPYREEALSIADEALGPDHPELMLHLRTYGDALMRTARAREAVVIYDRAVELARRTDAEPVDVDRLRFKKAEALWATGTELEEALDLARAVQKSHASRDDEKMAAAAQRYIDRWERERSGRR